MVKSNNDNILGLNEFTLKTSDEVMLGIKQLTGNYYLASISKAYVKNQVKKWVHFHRYLHTLMKIKRNSYITQK